MVHQLRDLPPGDRYPERFTPDPAHLPETRLRHVIVAEIKPISHPLGGCCSACLEKKKGHRVSIAGDPDTHWFSHHEGRSRRIPQVQVDME
jgi:hypothetical protein